MFPIVIKRDNDDDERHGPAAPVSFEVAGNGIFELRETAMYRSVTRVDGGIPGLAAEEESLQILAPKLPARLIGDVIGFFAEINRACGGEGVVILFYNPATSTYRAEAPQQSVPVYRNYRGDWITELSVKYQRVERPRGYLRCGSIHSHAELPAYASHTDCADETYEDGLHLVVGDLGHARLTLSASYTVAGARFALEVGDVTEAFDDSGNIERSYRGEWLERVSLEFTLNGRVSRMSLAALAELSGGSASRGGRLPVSLEDADGHSHSYH